jgi:hypothetical protein
MKVGFTGTREGMSQHQKEQFVLEFDKLGATEFHHGDCVGADGEAHDIVRLFFPDVKIICHPPKSNGKRAWKKCDDYMDPLPYLTRDEEIVKDTEFLIATPLSDSESMRSGTWTTIRYSRKAGKPRKILER